MWLLMLSFACAPKVAPASSAQAPVSDERARFVELSDDLLARSAEADVYEPAADLARRMADAPADPAVRAAALRLLASLRDHEEPEVNLGQPLITDPPPRREDAAGLRADARATATVLSARTDRAREALRRGDYEAAVDALEDMQGEPGFDDDARPYWEEAADGYVAAERERLGALYVAARKSPRAERITGLREVQQGLLDLLERFPDSPYRESLEESLGRVDRELDSVDL